MLWSRRHLLLAAISPCAALANATNTTATTTGTIATTAGDMNDTALDRASKLVPPFALSTEGGEAESAEWWLEHEVLLVSAWKQWDKQVAPPLPPLDAGVIHPELTSAMDRTVREPTKEHEARVRASWDQVLALAENDSKVSGFDPSKHHRVYRHEGFLTEEGVRRIRRHLDALADNAIPKRRPNAMNRNGLLLDPTIPGGIAGDPTLHDFVELLARDYLRPLGRSFFPEFAGDIEDDSKHYAFTIKYGKEDNDSDATESTTTAAPATADFDLKEHSDASLYTLNINLNLPEEGYSGSSLYFVSPQSKSDRGDVKQNEMATTTRCEIRFQPGTALLHRGMTKHGAQPLEGGKRNNLVVWVFGGTDGYVRIAPYEQSGRLSLRERWSLAGGTSSAPLSESNLFEDSSVFSGSGPTTTFETGEPSAGSVEL